VRRRGGKNPHVFLMEEASAIPIRKLLADPMRSSIERAARTAVISSACASIALASDGPVHKPGAARGAAHERAAHERGQGRLAARYDECMSTGKLGAARRGGLSAGLGVGVMAFAIGPIRRSRAAFSRAGQG
jgi:hypothetical protein